MNHRFAPCLLALLCAVALVTGCGGSDKTGAGHSFSYTLVGNPDTLDPQLAGNSSARTVLGNLFEGLFRFGEDGSVLCGVVKDYTVSEDELHYVFNLRTDSYWYQATEGGEVWQDAENPRAVTAKDFSFAFRRLFDPLYGSPYREQFRCLENAEDIIAGREDPSMIGVYARRDDCLEIVLDTPEPDLPSLLASTAALPCNEEFFTGTRGRYGLDERSVIGNGSFAVQRWLYDPYGKYNVIQMVRNPLNHAVNQVYPADLRFFIESAQADAERIFTAGKADCLVTTQNTLLGEKDLQVRGAFSLMLGLAANPQSHYGSAAMAEALSKALDREALRAVCTSDLLPAYGIFPPGVTLANKSIRELISDGVYREADREAAKGAYAAALTAAGIAEPEEGTVLAPSGLMDFSVMNAAIAQWSDCLGVHMRIEEVPQKDYEARLRSGDYTLALVALSGSDRTPESFLQSLLAADAVPFSDAETVRGLLKQTAAAQNLTDQIAALGQAEQRILADRCIVPLFYKQRVLICRQGITDVQFNPFSGAVDFSKAKCFT